MPRTRVSLPLRGRPRNDQGDPQVAIVGPRVAAALAEAGYGVKTAAVELRKRELAAISYQVLARIAAGEQKTCRQSVRDGVATLCDVPDYWLSGGPNIYRPSGILLSEMERRPDLDTAHEREVWTGGIDDAAATPDPPRVYLARWRLATALAAAFERDHPQRACPGFFDALRTVAWAGVAMLRPFLGMNVTEQAPVGPATREDVEQAAVDTLHVVRTALQPWIDGVASVDPEQVHKAVAWVRQMPGPAVGLILQNAGA